jgi:hypothetical protein
MLLKNHALMLFIPVLMGLSVVGTSANSDAALPDDVAAYCEKLYETDLARRLCVEREEAARLRLSRPGRDDIEAAAWEACIAATESWTTMEACIERGRRAGYAWTLWTFGGELVGRRLWRSTDWTYINGPYESPAQCEAGIADFLKRLPAAALEIDRSPSQETEGPNLRIGSVGPRDRFVATFADGRTFAWTFDCVQSNVRSSAQSP